MMWKLLNIPLEAKLFYIGLGISIMLAVAFSDLAHKRSLGVWIKAVETVEYWIYTVKHWRIKRKLKKWKK